MNQLNKYTLKFSLWIGLFFIGIMTGIGIEKYSQSNTDIRTDQCDIARVMETPPNIAVFQKKIIFIGGIEVMIHKDYQGVESCTTANLDLQRPEVLVQTGLMVGNTITPREGTMIFVSLENGNIIGFLDPLNDTWTGKNKITGVAILTNVPQLYKKPQSVLKPQGKVKSI